MIEKDYISNASIIQDLTKTGNFEKYGINSKEELELLIETIPEEFMDIKTTLLTTWEFKHNDNSKSLFEIRNRLQQEITYLELHDYLLKNNIEIDYSKLRKSININEIDSYFEVVKTTISSNKQINRTSKKYDKNDYFDSISRMNRLNKIRSSFEEQIKKIDNAINKNVYINKPRNKTK